MFTKITAANIKGFYETLPEHETNMLLGQPMFPPSKQMGMELSFIKGRSQAPVSLRPSALDANPTLRDRLGIQISKQEMPFFREQLKINETDRQKILMIMETGQQALIDMTINNVFADAASLVAAAEVVNERMRMQLITTGEIQVKDNGVDYSYDYGFNKKKNMLTLTDTAKWDKPETADGLSDIEVMMSRASTSGKPELMILNTKTFLMLKNQASVQARLGKNITVGTNVLKEYIQGEFGLTIVLNDNAYSTEVGGKEFKYIPDGVISLTPKVVGRTVYGTTPEEADLLYAKNKASDIEIVNTGVAIKTTVSESGTVNVDTTVSQISMPSGENIDSVYIINAI